MCPFKAYGGDHVLLKNSLTHGYQTAKKKISSSSIYFESMPYQVDSKTGLIDYDRLEENAALFRPKLLVCGASAYPREWDYAKLQKVPYIATWMLLVSYQSGITIAGVFVLPV